MRQTRNFGYAFLRLLFRKFNIEQLQERFPWEIKAVKQNLGWVGLELTTNALKGRQCIFVRY